MAEKTMTKRTPKARHSPMEHPRHQYPEETAALRAIAQGSGLAETIKWGKPCFMWEGKNIVLLQRLNKYVALMFFQGALLADPGKHLCRIGEHMEGPRQLRFKTVAEVLAHRPLIEAYLAEAVALAKSGARLQPKKVAALAMPDELQARLRTDPALKQAFEALTPGRQKGYVYEIGAAKQASTRAARVEKHAPRILAGKGLND